MTKSRERQGDPDPPDATKIPQSDESDEEIFVAEAIEDSPLLDLDLSAANFAEPPAPKQLAVEVESKPPPLPPKQLVLVGAGRAHLQIINWWPWRRLPGIELTLVSAFDQAAYSNMLSGVLSERYRTKDMLIDLPRLCARRGVRLIVDRANSFDPFAQEIGFAHQPKLKFDLASINIGSVPSYEALWQSHRIMISVKPLSTFLARFEARFHELVEQWKQAPSEERLQVAVVGGGTGGVELAFGLEQKRYDLELPIDVRIVDADSEILPGFSASTIRRVKKLFHKRGIEMSLGSAVVDCDDLGPSSLILGDGQRIRADLVIWATNAAPPMAVKGFQLPKSPEGFLTIRSTMQSTAEVPVFVAGDVADLAGTPLQKSGVTAADQARVLWQNLSRWFSDRPLAIYRPRRHELVLLSCGDGTGILSYKRICLHGRWVWWLKNWIDRRWVRQFRV